MKGDWSGAFSSEKLPDFISASHKKAPGKLRIALVSILLLLCLSPIRSTPAVESPPEKVLNRWWINLSLNNTGAIGFSTRKDLLWTVRSSYIGGLGSPGQSPNSAPSWDIAIMPGLEWRRDWGSVSVSGGVALTVVRTAYTVGMPVDIHVITTPTSFAGVGLSFIANLNGIEPYAQIAFTIRIGKL